MRILFKPMQNESGVIIVVALLVMVILTLIGISSTTTTSLDLQVAASDKFHKMAFYNADSGTSVAPKLISKTVDNNDAVTGDDLGTKISYIQDTDGDDFYRQVLGFDAYDNGLKDMQYYLGTYTVQVDVQRTGQESLVGGGAEFAAGAEGIGVGSTGGVALLYDMDSTGEGPSSASSNIVAGYRKVTGMPGGL